MKYDYKALIIKYKLYLAALLLFLVSAFFSKGFMHPDEHYSILELLNLKLGGYQDLTIFNWDINDKIRPWTQVFIYYLVSKTFMLEDPFIIANAIRIFNGLIAFTGLLLVGKKFFEDKDGKKLFWVSTIWFVPYLLVRTSSESLSISLFAIGSYYFCEKDKKSISLSALFFGLSFLCRYQMGIVVFVAGIWKLVQDKKINHFVLYSLVVLAVVLMGILIDYWGYGEWVFTPYNYLYQNIILKKANDFGTDPFIYYFYKPIIKSGLLSAFFLGAFSVYTYKNKNAFWTWVLLSFLLVHSLIAHKEVRFLAFVYVIVPFIFLEYIESVRSKKGLKYLFKLGYIVNIALVLKVMLTPAHGLVKFYQYVYKQDFTKVYTPIDSSGAKFEFTVPFYIQRKIETLPLEKIEENYEILTIRYRDYLEMKERNDCRVSYAHYPSWIYDHNYFNWLKRSSIPYLWDCELEKKNL